MPATPAGYGTLSCSNWNASTAPIAVPQEPIRNKINKRPDSFQIFLILHCINSNGIAKGTIYPQIISSNQGACVGIIFRFVKTRAPISAIIAPESFDAQA